VTRDGLVIDLSMFYVRVGGMHFNEHLRRVKKDYCERWESH